MFIFRIIYSIFFSLILALNKFCVMTILPCGLKKRISSFENINPWALNPAHYYVNWFLFQWEENQVVKVACEMVIK
jgi:hypothetical protein